MASVESEVEVKNDNNTHETPCRPIKEDGKAKAFNSKDCQDIELVVIKDYYPVEKAE
jgi:hypothetical protein